MTYPLENLMWAVYNVQGPKGGESKAMLKAMAPLAIPEEMREMLCDHIASKGFVSPIYIRACMEAALDFLGGNLREVSNYLPPDDQIIPLPNWNDYAIYVAGAKFDEE